MVFLDGHLPHAVDVRSDICEVGVTLHTPKLGRMCYGDADGGGDAVMGKDMDMR